MGCTTMAETNCLRLLICLLFVLMASPDVGGRKKRQVPATTQPLLQSTCILSNGPTPTPLHIAPTDCSLGEIKRSLKAVRELRAAGLYLIPDPIVCNGTLVFAETCAFLNRLMETTKFRLIILVYRESSDTRELILIDRLALIIEGNATTTQGCGSLSGNIPVNKGDRVGVQIDASSHRTCPAQANLMDAACASALYLPPQPLTSRIRVRLSDFTTVGVNLNVRVSIVPTTSQPLHVLQPTSTSLRYVTPHPLHILHTVTEATGDNLPAKQLLDPGQIAGVVVAAVGFSLLFLVIVPLIIFCLRVQRRYTRKQEETLIDGKTTLSNSAYMESTFHQTSQSSAKTLDTKNPERAPPTQTDTTTRSTVSEQLCLLPQNLVIHGSCIKLLKSIGEGAFGIVYKAHYSRHEGSAVETVAVKSLKAIFTSGDLQNLVKEIQLMQYFDHPNVMPLLGVCLNAGCLEAESAPCLVMPYMENGSLLTYLRKAKKALVLPKDATLNQVEQVQRELFKMCYEIALGMNYLAEKKFVHRDLSARNCMMGSDCTMKVADFGLAEDIYTRNYFRVDTSEPIAVPFKWMPLESLHEGIYNEKTDMWSFGITTWEIFTGGKIPYTAMSVREILQLLKNGGRLDKPENAACSEEIYTMMLDCWDDDPEKRPCFLQVVTTLSKMLQTMSGYLDLNQLPPLQPPDDPTNSPSCIEEVPPGLSTPIEM